MSGGQGANAQAIRISIDPFGRAEVTLPGAAANLPPGDYDAWIDTPPAQQTADPCPGCPSGTVCRTPTCGRLAAAAPWSLINPEAAMQEAVRQRYLIRPPRTAPAPAAAVPDERAAVRMSRAEWDRLSPEAQKTMRQAVKTNADTYRRQQGDLRAEKAGIPLAAPLPPAAESGASDADPFALPPPTPWPKGREAGRIGDMTPAGKSYMRVGLDADNDVYVYVFADNGRPAGAGVEFCTAGSGGGKSPNTRMALIALMVAMELDSEQCPWGQWPRVAEQQAAAGQTEEARNG